MATCDLRRTEEGGETPDRPEWITDNLLQETQALMGESEHAVADLIVAFWQLLDVVWRDESR
jgi:hypothetical protein